MDELTKDTKDTKDINDTKDTKKTKIIDTMPYTESGIPYC